MTVKFGEESARRITAVDPGIRLLPYPARPIIARNPAYSDEERAQADAALAEAEIVIGSGNLTARDFQHATNVKWLQFLGQGVDGLAEKGLLGRGFAVTNLRGLAAVDIAEYCIAMMMLFAKKVPDFMADRAQGNWKFRFLRTLHGATCAVLGMGAIGRETARRARALGMRVTAMRLHAEPGASDPDCDLMLPIGRLDELLASADYLVLSVPLTDATRGMLNAESLAKLKDGAVIVNVARGEVIDQDALVAALKSGKVGGAALDVATPEPLPAGHPLWSFPNVLPTGHSAAAARDYEQRAVAMFIGNLKRYLSGAPLENVVDPAQGY
jgi:phosphoglycerate dehydrogenase-like enzyme